MRGRWRVGGASDEIWVVRRFADIPEGAKMISPAEAAWSVEEWFPYRGSSEPELSELYAEIGGAFRSRHDAGSGRMLHRLREAFRKEHLKAYRPGDGTAGGRRRSKPDQPDKPDTPKPPEEQKTWVAIELLDDSTPPKPVPFKKYRIELPDKSVREGMLDANGQAMISDIDPGTCKVSFPQIHGEDWKPA